MPSESSRPITLPLEQFRSLCAKVLSTSQSLETIVRESGNQAPGPSTSTSQLSTQLKILNTVTTRLHQTLQNDARHTSDNTIQALQSATTTTNDILLEILDNNNIHGTHDGPVVKGKRASVSSRMRSSFRLSSSSSIGSEDEQQVEEYIRMVVTQSQIFSLIDQVLSLETAKDQDSALETSENLKVLLRGARDAERLRERRQDANQRIRTGSSSHDDSLERLGSASTHNLSTTTTKATSVASDTWVASSGSPVVANLVTSSQAAKSPPLRKTSTSISKLFGALKVGSTGIRTSINVKSSADVKLAFSQLCQACRDGDIKWVRHQITVEGADVNSLDSKHYSPLHYAVLSGNLDLVKVLVESGAWVSGADGRSSIMVFLAVQKRNLPILTYLLEERSAPVSSRCCDSRDKSLFRTPLSVAVETGQIKAVELLIKHGADVQESDMAPSGDLFTPLCAAVNLGNKEMVQLLLKCQAAIDATRSTTSWGSELGALHVASYNGHHEVLETLIEGGANIGLTCRRTLTTGSGTTGVTALHLASGRCAEILLHHGASVFSRDSNGQFPLSGVVQLQDVESVKTLLEKGAPVNAQDRKGDTALHIAVRLFARDAVRITDKIRRSGTRASHVSAPLEKDVATLGSYIEMVAVLLERGANTGSRVVARRIILAECEGVMARRWLLGISVSEQPAISADGEGGGTEEGVQDQPPQSVRDINGLDLVELMKFVHSIVQADQQQAAKLAASSNNSDQASLRNGSGVGSFLSQTTLAQLVTR